MDRVLVLKAIADETRMNILMLLLQHNYCVRALARKLNLSEAAVSQHLKVLRKAGLLTGEKRGYFMHYDVNRGILHELSADIEELAAIERQSCTPEEGGCHPSEQERCHARKEDCSAEVKEFCHGPNFELNGEGQNGRHGNCHCHKPE